MRVSALNVNSMHCPALREGRAPIPRPGCQEAVGCEEVSNQGQVFEAHEQGGNRRANSCSTSSARRKLGGNMPVSGGWADAQAAAAVV